MMEKAKTKTVYSTELPYSEIHWPSVSDETADAILSLLAPVLKPIGDHTRQIVPKSSGRGRGKRDPQRRKTGDTIRSGQERPEISSSLTIGFNGTVRVLEDLSGATGKISSATKTVQSTRISDKDSSCLAVVFVCRSALPEPVSQSLPLLVAAASHRTRDAQPIRLVELSTKAEAAASAALGLPRVSVLSVYHDAPGAGPLLRLIQEHTEPVEVPWLEEAASPIYLPVKVNAVEAALGSKKPSRKRKRATG